MGMNVGSEQRKKRPVFVIVYIVFLVLIALAVAAITALDRNGTASRMGVPVLSVVIGGVIAVILAIVSAIGLLLMGNWARTIVVIVNAVGMAVSAVVMFFGITVGTGTRILTDFLWGGLALLITGYTVQWFRANAGYFSGKASPQETEIPTISV
jgi:hypothetical protein